MKKLKGIHHITAIVGDPLENKRFYESVLGLKLVKKTVNFDDPSTYHLYFGDKTGRPGTIMTFFPWQNAASGQIGNGQVGVTRFAVGKGMLKAWEARLLQYEINYRKIKRFDKETLEFSDPHGLNLELVEEESSSGFQREEISDNMAIKGFSGATLYSEKTEETIKFLIDHLAYKYVKEEAGVTRLKTESEIGQYIDVTQVKENGRMGVGTVHHIAFRNDNDMEQKAWQAYLFDAGFRTTEVRDRHYFKSIYFKEPGNILYEMATDDIGFTVDEELDKLGQSLMLPPQYEGRRSELEKKLKPLN